MRQPTRDDLELAARQRINCRCGLCGALLAEDVSVNDSIALIDRHRREDHGLVEVVDQQAGNRAAREAANQRVLDALDNEWISVRELSKKMGMNESAVRQRLNGLAADGRAERLEGRSHATYRRAA